MNVQAERSPTVRDVVTVTVSEPVDGTVRRRKGSSRRVLATPVETTRVDPRVWAAVKKAKRPGEVVLVVSETEVWLVPELRR